MTNDETPGMDSGLLSPVRAGTPVEREVADEAWLQAMLDAEAALARAQAGLGTLPAEAADVIGRVARADRIDLRALAVAARESANPVVALVRAFTEVVAAHDPSAAQYVHRGSTSQDIFDTGAMLVCARALRLVRADLLRVADALDALAERHGDTLMAGRTLGLHAVPTTFGLKAAGWSAQVREAGVRVGRLVDGGLPVSLGGAAGTLAGYLQYAAPDGSPAPDPAAYATALTGAFAAETGLAAPVLPWHALRGPLADVAAALAFVTGSLGKIAVDVQSLGRTEVGEVAEPAVSGRGASSAMPHKRNPVLATLIRAASLQVPALAGALTQCLVTEDERSGGVWHAEWLLLRECLRLAGGASHTAVELCEGLAVDAARMGANARATGALMASERVSAVLALRLGTSTAKRVVSDAAAAAARTGRPLAELLVSDPGVAAVADEKEIAALLDPAAYTGAASSLVRLALADARAGRTSVARSVPLEDS
ncbi:class-II fumarase/aspartase family protein [Streptomyces sp. CA-253872]|uniref:class-II fumarase/aspartase family protein n=1 Tax=Streptomyces sp. CA-253872 TaxID=3240067 RepID=UPI003D92A64B